MNGRKRGADAAKRKGKGRSVVEAQVKRHAKVKTRAPLIRLLVAHTQSGPLIGMKTRMMPAPLNTSSARQENAPFQKRWCFGLTVTGVENGHMGMSTVVWAPTQPHVGLFVPHVALELVELLFSVE